ncbi:MAG: hypothetical protein E7261_07875 [Lachnospiraceae bacterium]|nr:hypothetical protein [Lachnospiraceae bacterium]
MKKKVLIVLCIVVVLMIATTVTVMAHGGIIKEETVQNLQRCIPLFAAIASALTAECVALIARRVSNKEDKSQIAVRKEVRA